MIEEERFHLNKKQVLEIYKEFQDNYDLYLVSAKKMLGLTKLSFSFEEIDKFGIEFKKHYKKLSNLKTTFKELLNVFIVYYGEAFMHYFGGYYVFTTKKLYHFYGYPCIIDYGPLGEIWSGIPPHCYALFLINNEIDEPLSNDIKIPFDRDKKNGYSKEQIKRTIIEWEEEERKKEFGSISIKKSNYE